MSKLNASRMKLVILLLLSLAVATLARPQSDNVSQSEASKESGSSENSGESNGGTEQISKLVDAVLNALKELIGEEPVGLLKTELAPLYQFLLKVNMDTVTGILDGTKGITSLLKNNPLSDILESLPVQDIILSPITSAVSTPLNIIKYIISILKSVFGTVSSLL